MTGNVSFSQVLGASAVGGAVALSSLPVTGSNTLFWGLLALTVALAIVVLVVRTVKIIKK